MTATVNFNCLTDRDHHPTADLARLATDHAASPPSTAECPSRAPQLDCKQHSVNDNTLLEPVPVAAHDGLLALFHTVPVVALGEAHWLDQQHRLIRELLFDERFAEAVDAVVVEFGNALHQPLIDRYLAGEDVAASELRRVWSECVGGWFSRAFESPVYAEFFETVRASRRTGRSERPRVLLGDPPFDPQVGTGAVERALGQRDEHLAGIVAQEVLVRRHRALLVAGSGHLTRRSDLREGNVVQRLEREAPGCCTVVLPHYVFEDIAERRRADIERLERKLERWKPPALALIHGTWLGEVDASLYLSDTAGRLEPDGTEIEIRTPLLDDAGRALEHVSLAEVADAFLYLGPIASLTLAEPPAGRAVSPRGGPL